LPFTNVRFWACWSSGSWSSGGAARVGDRLRPPKPTVPGPRGAAAVSHPDFTEPIAPPRCSRENLGSAMSFESDHALLTTASRGLRTGVGSLRTNMIILGGAAALVAGLWALRANAGAKLSRADLDDRDHDRSPDQSRWNTRARACSTDAIADSSQASHNGERQQPMPAHAERSSPNKGFSSANPPRAPSGIGSSLQPGGTLPGGGPGASVGSLGTGGAQTENRDTGSLKRAGI
jgi:hypothetical protein